MITLTFKVSPAEARAIRDGARQERISVSEYLRRRAACGGVGPAKPRLKRCPVTGARIFAPTASLPPLTVESTRELLGDFP